MTTITRACAQSFLCWRDWLQEGDELTHMGTALSQLDDEDLRGAFYDAAGGEDSGEVLRVCVYMCVVVLVEAESSLSRMTAVQSCFSFIVAT